MVEFSILPKIATSDAHRVTGRAPGKGIATVIEYLEAHRHSFDPDEIVILVEALDQAWAAVQASGASFDGAEAQSTRNAIAK